MELHHSKHHQAYVTGYNTNYEKFQEVGHSCVQSSPETCANWTKEIVHSLTSATKRRGNFARRLRQRRMWPQ